MRKVLVLLWLVVSTLTGVVATAAPTTPRLPISTPVTRSSLAQQLTDRIVYPHALGRSDAGRVLVIRFRVDESQRLSQLEVFSNNPALTEDITRQLVGSKLALSNELLNQTFTVRLRFESNE